MSKNVGFMLKNARQDNKCNEISTCGENVPDLSKNVAKCTGNCYEHESCDMNDVFYRLGPKYRYERWWRHRAYVYNISFTKLCTKQSKQSLHWSWSIRNVKRWKDLWTTRAVSRVMFLSTLPCNPTHNTLQFIVVGWSSVMYHPTTTRGVWYV